MPPPQEPPNPLGHFRLSRTLGRGGMATVYDAEDTRLGTRIALKVSHHGAADAGPIERFHREARFAQRLHHPFVCPVFEDGEIDGYHYLTMPLVEGVPLEKRIGLAHPWLEPDAASLIRRLALALHAVHQAGVIHRDLKPNNVMLKPTGEPVLMDFGLARDISGLEVRMTAVGVALGTLAYIPPEQARGNPDAIGPPTDVYGLGVILYLMLVGRLPFDAPNPGTLYQKILNDAPPRPSDLRPGLNRHLEAIVLRTLAKSPADRFATMADLAAALEAIPWSVSRLETTRAVTLGPGDVLAPGTWYARPAGSEGDWTKFATSPGRIEPRAGQEYRFVADRDASERHLVGLADTVANLGLASLDLRRCEGISDAAFREVARIASLGEFVVSVADVSDAGFAAVAGLPLLERAEFTEGSRLADASLGHLAKLPRLARLALAGWAITDLGLRRLAALPLVELSLEDCHRVGGSGLKLLNRPGGLRSLTLAGGRGIVDDSLAAVATLPDLERLELRNCSLLTGSGFTHLTSAASLRDLRIVGCRSLSDDGLARLAELPGLRALHLSGAPRITEAGAAKLSGNRGLERLEIVDCDRIPSTKRRS